MVAGPRKELLVYSERGKRRDAVPQDFSPNLELFNLHERRCLEGIKGRMKGLKEEEEVIKDLLEAGLICEDFKAIQDNLALSESVLRRYVFAKFPSEIVKLRVPGAALEALNQGKRIAEYDNAAAPRSSQFQSSASGAPVLPPQPRATAATAIVPQTHHNHQHHRPAPRKKPVTITPASACGPGDIDREEARPQAASARALGSDDSSDELFVSRTRRFRSTTATSGDTAVTSGTFEQLQLDEDEDEEQQQKKKPAKNPRKRLKQMADTRPKRRKLNPEDRPYDPEREEQKRRNSLIFD